MLGNCPTGSRIAFYIPRYEYQRNENSSNKPKIQSNEWIKTCKYFIDSNDKLQQGDNSLPPVVNKEYLSNFLNSSIEGNNTNIVLYGDKDEDITTDINNCFHIRTVTSIITEAYKKIDKLSTKLENESKKRISLSIKYYTLISENEVMDLLNDNLDENYRIINIKKNQNDINASFTSEIYERNWYDKIIDLDVEDLPDILNAFYEGYQHFQNSDLVKKVREKSINIPKLIFSLVVKTTYKPNERSLIRKYEPLTVLNIVDFTTIQTNMDNDGYSAEVKTILNIITGLKSNLFYSPYLNPPYWSQTQYSPRDCQTLIVLFSQASAESLDSELNELLISLNILSDPKKDKELENNKNTNLITNENLNENKNDNNDKNIDKNIDKNSDDINGKNDINIINKDDETMNKNSNTAENSNKNNNKKSYIKNKTPEQIDTLINNYQKQIKDYFDKDIAKTNYIERIENELENCKKMLNSYSISDSFLRKKFVEMNFNMKMYKEQIDELEQIINEKERQILEHKQEQQKRIDEEEKLSTMKMEKSSQTDDIPTETVKLEESQSNEPIKSENEEKLEKEIQSYKDNEAHYIKLLEDIELTKSFKSNNFEQNKNIIEYYLSNLKRKIDNITQDLKSINIFDNSKAEDTNEESVSLNKSIIINEQSSIINNQNDNPISYEIYRLNEILKEKEKENCLLKDKIKKLESAPISSEKEKEESIRVESTPKIMNDPIEDDIYTIQINRIRELEKNLHDVTCERDNNMSKISDLEFSLMKAQTLILSNTLNREEEEKHNESRKNSNVNNNLIISNDNVNENNDTNAITNQNTSFYLSEFSSIIPPSPPSVSAFSPPTSPTSIASDESEPLYLTENVYQNLRKYKKSSKSRENSKNHSRSNSNKNNDNYYSDNNFELNSPSRSINMYGEEDPQYNISITKPKYNKQNNRNTLYICDGLESMYNSIEDKKSRQQITEKLSSLCLDSPKKRDFDKEHRRANSIDCFNIESNKYYSKPNLDLLCNNKSCSFANYEDAKESKKEEDVRNKSYHSSIRKNEIESFYDNDFDDSNEDIIKDYTNKDENYSFDNDKRDTYVKLPQMVVEYDRSRITIKSEEIDKLIPLNYILQEKKSHHHSTKKATKEICSSPSSYTYENPSTVSSPSKSHHHKKITSSNNNTSMKSPSVSSNSKTSKSHSKTRKSSKSHHQNPSDNYMNQSSNTTIKNVPHHSQSMIVDKKRIEKESNKSNMAKKITSGHEKECVSPSENDNDNINDSKANIVSSKINNVSSNNFTSYSINRYGNYINYNSYNNYNTNYSDDNNSSKITDKYKIPRNKVKSNSKLSSPTITKNESSHISTTGTTYNKNSHTILATSKEQQKQLSNDNNMILNKEVLDELRMNSSQDLITASTNSFTSDEEDDNETSSEETSSASDLESTTYSNDSDNSENESCSEEEDTENEDVDEDEDDKREYPSYIIKQNDSSKFLYNEPYESYNMNQYDLTQSSDSRKSSASSSKKKHTKKSKHINSTHDTIKKSRHDNKHYTHNNKSNSNRTNENINKSNNYGSYTNSPKHNYSNMSVNHSHIKKSHYESSVLKNYNSNSLNNNNNNGNTIVNNNSIYNYNMSYSQQQNSYNPLSSLTYINNNSSNYGSALNNSNNLSMNYSSINIKSNNNNNNSNNNNNNSNNNNNTEKKQREVVKKRKIPQEKKSSNNKTNENLMKLNQLPLNELQNSSSKKNTNYNDKSVYQTNNNIYHSSLNNTNGSINNLFNSNKENFNNSNSNFSNSYKDISESKRKPKEKEETSNIYKLSHRISKIFSSKKSNLDKSKRLSHASLDTLQSDKNNGHSSIFTPGFFHNESNKRNSIAIMDTTKINYFDAEPYESIEKYIIPPKKSYKHLKKCLTKKTS